MPNVINMRRRIATQLNGVSGRALDKEYNRIDMLERIGRVSEFTAKKMRETAVNRLAHI